jgi:hypothetical protein
MKKIFLTMLFAATAFSASQAALLTYNATVLADRDSQTFSFTQFDTSLGTLTAVDLIINSSVAGGDFTLSRAGGGVSSSASYSGLNMALVINDDYDVIFNGSTKSLATTGNSSIARPSTNTYLVIGSQSLLDSAPYTASIASGAWSYYQGSGIVTLQAGLTTDALYTAGRNITPNYTDLLATTSTMLRYTYTATPSGVPEPSQIAASLLVVAGLGIYFIRRRKVAELSH